MPAGARAGRALPRAAARPRGRGRPPPARDRGAGLRHRRPPGRAPRRRSRTSASPNADRRRAPDHPPRRRARRAVESRAGRARAPHRRRRSSAAARPWSRSTAEPRPGEVSRPATTARWSTINGVRDRLRVLLVSGEPHAGERTWRRLLKADPNVDLVHFTILRPPEKDDLTPLNELALIAFPVRELFQVKLREFDLIVFDRFSNRGMLPLAYLRNIADYVRGGGALLMSVGPEFAGPTSPGAHAARPGAAGARRPGRRHSGGRAALPPARHGARLPPSGHRGPARRQHRRAGRGASWGRWYRRAARRCARRRTLMEGPDGAPLLVLDRVGEGRVALLLSDHIWLWSRGHDGGGPQAGAAAPRRALADAGAGARGGGPDRAHRGRPADRRAPQPRGRAAARGHRDRARWHHHARTARGARRPRATLEPAGDAARRVAGDRRPAHRLRRRRPPPTRSRSPTCAPTPTRLRPLPAGTGGAVRWLGDGGRRRPCRNCAASRPGRDAARRGAGSGCAATATTRSPASPPCRCCRPGWRCRWCWAWRCWPGGARGAETGRDAARAAPPGRAAALLPAACTPVPTLQETAGRPAWPDELACHRAGRAGAHL